MEIQEFIEKFKVTLDFDKSIIITPETQFQQIDGWSSIMIVQLVVMFDEEFGKDISFEEIKNCTTIRDLATMDSARTNFAT